MAGIAGELQTHLPYLRRLARALCGTQESGDAYVAQTLETLVADTGLLQRYPTTRETLYATFLRLWNAVGANSVPDERVLDPQTAAADRNLQTLSSRARQAFLLVSMEGFSTEAASRIMGIDDEELRQLIARATQEIGEQVATDVLIIEDEPMIAMDLESLMTESGHRVIGMASTHTEALGIVAERKPGLVLADIQLADGSSGIDAVNDMLKSFAAPIVFITAFPERLLTGEKPEPAFLITKPFDADLVKAIAALALFFEEKATQRAP